jgi:membrane protease YdiL (CAAX protease family)
VAITLPTIWLTSLIPGVSPGAQAVEAHAQVKAAFYLHPGMTAVRALLIYPLLEELFYRGLVMQLLRRYLPTWVAVGFPTLFFAVTHMGSGLPNVVFAFAVGLFFSWLVIKTGSLYSSILCHAAINLTALFVLNPMLDAHGYTRPEDFYRMPPLLMLVGSLALLKWGVQILERETTPAQRAFAAAP